MEIHNARILSEFCISSVFAMKKGADAPFSFEIAISSELLMLLQTFSCLQTCQSMARRGVLKPKM